MHRLEDRGVIEGYTIIINEMMLGMVIGAHIRLKPFPGEVSRVAAMLAEAPEIIEADRVTGDECFVAKTAVPDMRALEKLIDRFLPFADANAAVIQSTSVKRRIPKI